MQRRDDEWKEVRYVRAFVVPRKVPRGRVLVHNHIRPVGFRPDYPVGWSGFRAWTMKPHPSVGVCKCGWAPLVRRHYRVARRLDRSEAQA